MRGLQTSEFVNLLNFCFGNCKLEYNGIRHIGKTVQQKETGATWCLFHGPNPGKHLSGERVGQGKGLCCDLSAVQRRALLQSKCVAQPLLRLQQMYLWFWLLFLCTQFTDASAHQIKRWDDPTISNRTALFLVNLWCLCVGCSFVWGICLATFIYSTRACVRTLPGWCLRGMLSANDHGVGRCENPAGAIP